MRLLSRKFWLTVGGIAVIAALQWFGKLDGVAAGCITTLVSGYMGLNVLQKGVVKP